MKGSLFFGRVVGLDHGGLHSFSCGGPWILMNACRIFDSSRLQIVRGIALPTWKDHDTDAKRAEEKDMGPFCCM